MKTFAAPTTLIRMPSRGSRWASLSWPAVWTGSLLAASVGGAIMVLEPGRAKYLLAPPLLVLALSTPPAAFLGGWLLIAPLLQGASSGGNYGHLWYRVLYLIPPLIVLLRMLAGTTRPRRVWLVDVVPALYFGYLVVSTHLFPSSFSSPALITYRSLYITVGVGVVAYYAVAFLGPAPRLTETVTASLLWGGAVAAALGIADGVTKWNIWHNIVANGNIYRAVSTFSNPAEFGTFVGMSAAFAASVLLFGGPARLRLPARLVLLLAAPALFLTYTRGPLLATVAVVAPLAVIARRARVAAILACALVAVLLFGSWGRITSSATYKDRLGVSTVRPRVVMSDVALTLFDRSPILGEGYGTFDRVKLTLPEAPGNAEIVATTTSHNTFLTVLAETGGVGLAFIVLPWIVLSWCAIREALRGTVPLWPVAACTGAIVIYAVSAVTFDTRFFSFLTALPWVAIALERRLLAQRTKLAAQA